MQSIPTCSVIIPFYNCSADQLEQILQCAVNIHADVEVLLIDDGSKQEIAEQADLLAMSSPNTRVIHTKHKGVSSARNAGIENATGRFITFCDVDDRVDPDAFNDILTEIGRLGSFDILICPYTKHRNGKVVEISCSDPYTVENLMKEPNRNGTVWGKLYRKAFLSDVRFHEKLSHAEDTLFLLELMMKSAVCASSSHGFYHYNAYPFSTSKSDANSVNGFLSTFRELYQLVENSPAEIQLLAGNCCIVNTIILLNHHVFKRSLSLGEQKESFSHIVSNSYVQCALHRFDRKGFPFRYRIIAYLVRHRFFLLTALAFKIYQFFN